MSAPTCNGHNRPAHEAKYVYHDGLCTSCRERRSALPEPIEPPDPEPTTWRDDDRAADSWERAEGRRLP